jgi:outer membrane protein
MGELFSRIQVVLDKYAKDNGYALVLDISSPQTPVMYASNAIDITREIIELYDKNAPSAAPAPAAAARPPVPKPAVPAAKPAAPPK